MSRPKAKFRVRQVVAVKKSPSGYCFRIVKIFRQPLRDSWKYQDRHTGCSFHETELRRLNKNERRET